MLLRPWGSQTLGSPDLRLLRPEGSQALRSPYLRLPRPSASQTFGFQDLRLPRPLTLQALGFPDLRFPIPCVAMLCMPQCRSTCSVLVCPIPFHSSLCSYTMTNSHPNSHPGVHVYLHLCMFELHPPGGSALLPTAVHSICPRTYSIVCSSSLLAYGMQTDTFGFITEHVCMYMSHGTVGNGSASHVQQQLITVTVTAHTGNRQVAAMRPTGFPGFRVPRP